MMKVTRQNYGWNAETDALGQPLFYGLRSTPANRDTLSLASEAISYSDVLTGAGSCSGVKEVLILYSFILRQRVEREMPNFSDASV